VDFSFASGIVKQPGAAEIKTDIIHGGPGTGRVFFHSPHVRIRAGDVRSQLLARSGPGGASGRRARLDGGEERGERARRQGQHHVPASELRWIDQPDQSLVASNFAEAFTHKFKHGVVLAQTVSATPTWNITNDWLANASVTLTVPAYKRLNIALGAIDSYLNNPPPSFKKNSFQLTTGLTYTLK
jgi:hypothetical protein